MYREDLKATLNESQSHETTHQIDSTTSSDAATECRCQSEQPQSSFEIQLNSGSVAVPKPTLVLNGLWGFEANHAAPTAIELSRLFRDL